MTVSISIHKITRAQCRPHPSPASPTKPFDVVDIFTTTGSANLFLPLGTGDAVAAAINAAVSPAIAEAAE